MIISLLSLVYHNSLLSNKFDMSQNISDVMALINTQKTDKDEHVKVMDIIKLVNRSAVPYSIDKLRQTLQMEVPEYSEWADSYVFEGISTEQTELNKLVMSEQNNLADQLKKPKYLAVLAKAFTEIKYNPASIGDVAAHISNLSMSLDEVMKGHGDADAAVLEEMDLDEPESEGVQNVIDTIAKSNDQEGVYMTGWQDLNEALQGGPRPGDFMMVGSLEHNYKSGLVRSLFRQITTYNDPPTYSATETKKPLAWFVSFEDPLSSHVQFIFQNIMFNKTRQPVKMKDYATAEGKAFVLKTVIDDLQGKGWHVRFSRVDPSNWTYRKFIEKVLAVEASGFNLRVMVADYVLKIPTVGCDRSGATGTDLRDMIMRLRNFFAAKKILLITPGQLAPAVKDELIKGTSEVNLLSWIAEKGLYAGSKQISQELDISLLIKKVRTGHDNKGPVWLDMLVEKHRIAQAQSDDKKHFALPFPPNGMPIPDDIGMVRIGKSPIPMNG
jgi:hypothetical protein